MFNGDLGFWSRCDGDDEGPVMDSGGVDFLGLDDDGGVFDCEVFWVINNII